MAFKVLGITDSVTNCDCCGKTNLKCTVELENEAGDVVFYGRDCAGRAIYGRKASKNAQLVESTAKAIQKLRPVIDYITNEVNKETNITQERINEIKHIGNEMCKNIRVNLSSTGVGGFLSWGFISIDWNGGRYQIPVK